MHPRDNPARYSRFHEVLVATVFGAALLTLLGWVLVWTVLRHAAVSPAEMGAIEAALRPRWLSKLQPEPVERWLHLLLCLAAPGCALAALVSARRLRRRLPGALAARIESGLAVVAGLALFGVVFVKTRLGFWLFPFQDLGNCFPFFPMSAWCNVGAIVLAAGVLLAVGPRGWMLTRGVRRAWAIGAGLLGGAILFIPRAIGVDTALEHSLSSWAIPMHFQACIFGLTQLCAGKALSLTMPLYGGYAEFLAPIFRLIGLSVLKVSLVMTTLCAVALAANLAVLARFIRQPAVLFLATAAMLYTFTGVWTGGQVPFDPYFQYLPVRVLFPALSIPLYLWVARQTKPAPWLAAGAFCGFALAWNLDSGIAVAGAVFFTATAETAARRTGLLNLAVAVAGMAAVFLGFSLYLQWETHGIRPLHTTAEYQRLFYEFGLLMIPVPDGLHPWMAILAVYLLGLTLGLRSFLDGRHSPFARVAVLLSILGAGLYTYYQGRSHDYNLITAGWPSVLLAFLLVDRLLRSIRAGILAPGMRWLGFAAAYVGVVAVLLFPAKAAILAREGLPRWQAALSGAPVRAGDSIRGQVEFIRSHTGTDRDCAILSAYQTVLYAETGFRFPYNVPGVSEMFFKADLDALHRALLLHPVRHLFVDFPMLQDLELSAVLAPRYRIVAAYRHGELVCMEPRPAAQK